MTLEQAIAPIYRGLTAADIDSMILALQDDAPIGGDLVNRIDAAYAEIIEENSPAIELDDELDEADLIDSTDDDVINSNEKTHGDDYE